MSSQILKFTNDHGDRLTQTGQQAKASVNMAAMEESGSCGHGASAAVGDRMRNASASELAANDKYLP